MNSSTDTGTILRAKDILRKPFTAEFLRYVIPGILVGVITGLVVGTFRWIIDQTLILLTIVYPYLGSHPLMIIPYILGTLIVVWLIAKIIRPELFDVVGSGVPQIEAILIGKHQMNWWSVLWRKFVSGLLTICPGLFLGREGPCIQIGACIGQGFAEDVYHYQDTEERDLLIKCGIAAGLSAAFSAPIAGTVFLLEEVTRHFNFKVIAGALAAAISADLMTILFFGTKPCLAMPISARLHYHHTHGRFWLGSLLVQAATFSNTECLILVGGTVNLPFFPTTTTVFSRCFLLSPLVYGIAIFLVGVIISSCTSRECH